MQAQVLTATSQILATGLFPAGSSDPAIAVIDLSESEAEALTQPGDKYLNPDGTIRVDTTRLEQQQADDVAAQQAAAQHQAALKNQIISEFTSEYRALVSISATISAPLLLRQSMSVAQKMYGVEVFDSDLPADLQQGLASLPSGS